MVTDPKARKAIPLVSGCLDYFPDALAAVAALSLQGNIQHNGDEPLYWNRAKSGDEADALVRHLLERGTLDGDGIRHTTKVAWRALALLQKELEHDEGAALPRGARIPVTSKPAPAPQIAPGSADEAVAALLPPGSAPGED